MTMTAVITLAQQAAPSIRRVRPNDRAALLAMYERCSPTSRYHRWHGHTTTFPAAYLEAVLSGAGGQVDIVAILSGQVVALASMVPKTSSGYEIAILVEDAHQHRGLGRAMVNRLAAEAREHGSSIVHAEMLGADAGLTRLLARHGPTRTRASYGVVTATLSLAGSR